MKISASCKSCYWRESAKHNNFTAHQKYKQITYAAYVPALPIVCVQVASLKPGMYMKTFYGVSCRKTMNVYTSLKFKIAIAMSHLKLMSAFVVLFTRYGVNGC